MTPRELERLLGGHAAGTLNEGERGELLRASLEDQQLFDALADEEALRDALADPVFRARMRARLQPEEKRNWLFGWPLAAMGAVAGAVVLAVMLVPREEKKVQQVAQSAKQAEVDAVAPSLPATPLPAEVPARKAKPVIAESPRQEAAAPVKEEVRVDEIPKILRDDVRLNSAPAAAAAPPPPPPASSPAPVMEREQRLAAVALIDLRLERERAGTFEPVRAEALVEGDRVRLQVTPSSAGTLEVVWTPAAGAARLERAVVEAGRTYAVPAAGGFAPETGAVVVRAAVLPATGAVAAYRARQSVGAAASASSDLKKAEQKEGTAAAPVELKLEFRRR